MLQSKIDRIMNVKTVKIASSNRMNGNLTQWEKDLEKSSIGSAMVAHISKGSKGESYDLLVILKLKDQKEPFFLFNEAKSVSNIDGNITRKRSSLAGTIKNWRQFIKIDSAIASITDDECNSVVLSALRNGRYLYPYMTTVDSPSIGYFGSHQLSKGKAIALGRESTKSFLGLIFRLVCSNARINN